MEIKGSLLKKLCVNLRRQDHAIAAIMEEREAIVKYAKEHDLYDELLELVYADGQSHWDF